MNLMNIQFNYPGANAQTVQSQVTEKVVNALKSVSNIEQLSANSQTGVSRIYLKLTSMKTDELLKTQIKIIQAISSVHLPSAVPQPVISQAAGRMGLVAYVVSSDKMTPFEINNFIESTLNTKFSSIPGVSTNFISSNPVVKIKLMPEKLAEYHLNASDITSRIDESYQSNPLGALYLNDQAYQLSFEQNINSLYRLENLVVGYIGQQSIGRPIFLRDIASIQFEPQSIVPTQFSSYNGRTSSTISLYTTTSVNPFTAFSETEQYVTQLKKSLPESTKIFSIFNSAKIMKSSFYEVAVTVGISSLLVLLIALLFLGHLRTTLIPVATIPICLLGTVAFLNLMGFTVTIFTLLAMVVSVGLVVDDAIVVVENITRYIEKGMKKQEAILHGTSEITLTIIAITLTLLAVYLPITFIHGAFITLIKAFAVPLSAAVFISGIISLTLTPIICTFLLSEEKENKCHQQFNTVFHNIIDCYQVALRWILDRSKLSIVTIICLIIIGAYFSFLLPKTFFPNDPAGFATINIVGNPEDTVESLKNKTKQFEKFYDNKYTQYYSVQIQPDPMTNILTAHINIHYKLKYLKRNPMMVDQINAFIKDNHIDNANASMNKFLNWGTGPDIQFYTFSDNIHEEDQLVTQLTKLMKQSKIFSMVINNIGQPHKELAFDVDSIKAANLGIYKSQISQLLSTYYGGYTLNNNFNIAGLSVPVVISLDNHDLENPESLQKLQILSPKTSQYYPLSDFVSLKMVAKPIAISTFNNQPSVMIIANLAKEYSMSDAIPVINNLISEYVPALHYQYTGNAEDYLQGNAQSTIIVIFGILSVYFLLTILFGSFLDPFIIMLTVPFSIIGGMLSLYLVHGEINVYSTIALITLIGLITKHGVLIVKFANQECEKGSQVINAILTATHHRFRPIIMTTLAMTLGALPLLLSAQYMYVGRENLGAVLIGGLMIGTFFSLFIVPLVYMLLKSTEVK